MNLFRHKWIGAALGAALLLALAAGLYLERASRIGPDGLNLEQAVLFQDREGRPLRFAPNRDGQRSLPVEAKEIPDLVRNAFLAAEDERFFSHHGVDLWAVLRAIKDNLLAGRIVSGASTITQQLCRMAFPRQRTLRHKLIESLRAVRLESILSKQEILTLYLNRVPLGNNVLGVRAAARLYFNLEPGELTPAQAALLASLPKSPGTLNPYGPNRDRLVRRWKWVLSRMHDLGYASPDSGLLLKTGFPALEPRSFPFEAPHAVDRLLKTIPAQQLGTTVETCIDLPLQQAVEEIVRSHRTRLKYRGADQAAAVVLANRGPEILALAGSLEYVSQDQGFNNGAWALRSPGSVLKPFLYAHALDQGFTASTVLEDLERRFRTPDGDYLATNFDRRVYGPVSMREALGNSLNLSAVNLLNNVGYRPFYDILNNLELINHPERGPDHYGLGLVVGNPEVSLVQIASAYACLANQGVFRPARLLKKRPQAKECRVFSPQASYIISQILSDPGARALTFGRSRAMNPPFPVALKTGTSTNYRDCWVVGFTPGYTVAVWVGNFDGRPTWGLSGATAAAPILSEILDHLFALGGPGRFPRPPGIVDAQVCTYSGMRPTAHCPHTKTELFIRGTEPREKCTFHQDSGQYHSLPAEYAGWVHTRHALGSAGRFRLDGFDQDLDRVFSRTGAVQGRDRTGAARALSHRQRIAITQPLEGDRFISQGGEMRITLTAALSRPTPQVTWFINGVQQAETGPPYQFQWRFNRGPHQVTAQSRSGETTSVSFVVE